MQCEYYALEGLSALVETIEALRTSLNPALEIEGVLRTMFDVRNNLANAVSAELTEHFGDRVFRTIVPRNVRLAEAPSHGQSIVGYDRASRGGVPGPGRRDHPPQQRTQQGRQGRGDRLMTSSKPAAKKRGLGRGLDALLGPKGAVSQVQATTAVIEPLPGEVLRKLPVGQLQPGKYQPRRGRTQAVRAGRLDQVAGRDPADPGAPAAGGNYEIVAGERRWRASQLAGLDEVPVVVRELEDRTVIAMALIENIQREDLNPLEEAEALQRLISEFTLTHAEAAEAVAARARRCPTCCACWSCRWRSACCWKPAAWKWATPARC